MHHSSNFNIPKRICRLSNRCVDDLLSFYITDEGVLQDTVMTLYLDAESDLKFPDAVEGA